MQFVFWCVTEVAVGNAPWRTNWRWENPTKSCCRLFVFQCKIADSSLERRDTGEGKKNAWSSGKWRVLLRATVTESLQVGQLLCFLRKCTGLLDTPSSKEHTLADVGQSCDTMLRPQISKIYVRACFYEALQKKNTESFVCLMRDLSLCVKDIILKQHLCCGIQNKLSRFKFCWSSISRYFTWLCICSMEDWLSTTQMRCSSHGGMSWVSYFLFIYLFFVKNISAVFGDVQDDGESFFTNSFLFAFL